MNINLQQGDCLELIKTLEDNSVDSIVTDPPYELGFMGKSWDKSGIANNIELWEECLRVLKPGGHLLSFSGTRTYHRMASAIEDAGFEVRDMIEWVYGSGFPKSLNIGKSVNQIETNEWSKIGKALDNIDQKSIMEAWKNNLNNVKIAGTQLEKNQTEIGICMLRNGSVQENAVENINQEKYDLLVSFAEQSLNEAQAINTKINTALQNVEAEIKQLPSPVKSAEKLSQNQNHKFWNIFTAQCDVKEWLNENIEVNHKVDEALKTLRGNKKYSNEEITNVLCVALTDILKLTILNQSKTFQNLGTNQKMECVSAINVIITEYTAGNLISNTVAILIGKAVDKLRGNEREVVGESRYNSRRPNPPKSELYKQGGHQEIVTKGTSEWEGWGTALKPAHEPICMARKPLSEKTVAENCLKWGTGGINIDESRVGTEERYNAPAGNKDGGNSLNMSAVGMPQDADGTTAIGRFPANLLHDGSEEVRACFPETKSGWKNKDITKNLDAVVPFGAKIGYTGNHYEDDNGGNASRYFKSIIYQAKASKKERNAGCEGLEEKELENHSATFDVRMENGVITNKKTDTKRQNNHPTVKPILLIQYLIKMITPKGGTVLDPFMGSGSTGCAAVENGYNFIGFDLTPEYVEIAKARIEHFRNKAEERLF